MFASVEEEKESAFIVSNINTCLRKIFPSFSETYEIDSEKHKLDEGEIFEITDSDSLIVIESGLIVFEAVPDIELLTGNIAGPVTFKILGKSEMPKIKALEQTSLYVVNIEEIEDLISRELLRKEQERMLLTKAFDSPSSNLVSSFGFMNLIKEMSERFEVKI